MSQINKKSRWLKSCHGHIADYAYAFFSDSRRRERSSLNGDNAARGGAGAIRCNKAWLRLNAPHPALMERLANRLSPQAGKSLVISRLRERELASQLSLIS